MFSITRKIVFISSLTALCFLQDVAIGSNNDDMLEFTDFLPQRDIRLVIIKLASQAKYESNENPLSIARVSREWNNVISKEKQKKYTPCWKNLYGISPKNEEIFRRFLKGVLLFKPSPIEGDYTNAISFPIRLLKNPLDGTFDLSSLYQKPGARYPMISTGYKKANRPENKGKEINEVWITPRFLIAKMLLRNVNGWNEIINSWDENLAPFGLTFTRGDDFKSRGDYIIDKSIDDITSKSLYDVCQLRKKTREGVLGITRDSKQLYLIF